MNIKQLSGNHLPHQHKTENGISKDIGNGNAKPETAHAGSGLPSQPGTDRVDISSQAQKVQQAIDSLQSVAEVDKTKVSDLKTAIASGNYQVNSSHTAEKLLEFENDLQQ